MHKLTAGDGYAYLTRQVAAQDVTARGRSALGDYYAQEGETPGVWLGRGLAGLPPVPGFGPVVEAALETAVTPVGEGAQLTLEAVLKPAVGVPADMPGSRAHRIAGPPAGVSPGVGVTRLASSVTSSARAGEWVSERQMMALFGEGRHPDQDEISRVLRAEGASEKAVDRSGRLGRPFHVSDQETPFAVRSARAFRAYNKARGLLGDTPVPEVDRAWIRTSLAREMFAEEHARGPADARELSGFMARLSRQKTTAVAGYDLTFSPVKSVSTLWAVARREVSELIAAAHEEAVADAIGWLEDHAAYTRRGKDGVAQVDVTGLIGASFTHRDSRSGDPDLHTHVAVSNKVRAADGTWLALDGRAVYRNAVTASERYNTRLEALLVERLGVTFAPREPVGVTAGTAGQQPWASGGGSGAGSGPGQRPVREIVGIDGPLTRSWSSRRAAIEVHRAALSAQFQADHGRPPTAKESIALAQQANLATRQAKHEPRSLTEQRRTWRAEAAQVLGGQDALRTFVRGALGTADLAVHAKPLPVGWATGCATGVLTAVSATRATWQEHHVRAEAQRCARAHGIRLADLDRAVDELVAVVLDEHSIALDPVRGGALGAATQQVQVQLDLLEPEVLHRGDGTSVYTVAGSTLFTSHAVVDAEQRILAAADRVDGPALTLADVDLAVPESLPHGVALNPGQAALVRELATSPARVKLALAPAGTGKTTAMRILARAWTGTPIPLTGDRRSAEDSHGTVLGLAPSAAAATVLRDEISPDGPNSSPDSSPDSADSGSASRVHADTVAKLLTYVYQDTADARWTPAWVRDIGPRTMVVLDEAGMAGTVELADSIDFLLARGATVRLVGDDQQLAAIGAGGVLRDLAHTHGAVTLSQVMRFTHPAGHPSSGQPNHAEGAASLGLRDGDPAAVAYYTDHSRVHVGDLSTVTDLAYTAWQADRAHGMDSLMVAPTRDLVTGLNTRARADRIAAATLAGHAEGRTTDLTDGTQVSAGDTIVSGKNDRTLAVTKTDWVKNGDRWTVRTVGPDGALHVLHGRTGRHITLPADYVASHVALGYASTVHGAQGSTADTCHTVATGAESRQLLYVAMTRGRHANHLYLTTAGDGEEHTATHRDTLLAPTAVDVLTRVLARDGAPVSAASTERALADPASRLKHSADSYHDALTQAAERVLGADTLAGIDRTAEQHVPGLTRAPGWPTLRSHLAVRLLHGSSPTDSLHAALHGTRGLADAQDPAAVLDYRLDPTGQHHQPTTSPTRTPPGGQRNGSGLQVTGPLPWLPAVPAPLATDPTWGRYLARRAQQVQLTGTEVRAQARAWTPTTAPAWALALLTDRLIDGPIDGPGDRSTGEPLVVDVAVWRAATGVDPTDLRPTGPPLPGAADRRAQTALNTRVTAALGDSDAAAARWHPLAESLDPHLTGDPYWPVLARQLSAAERAGIDIAALTRTSAAARPLPDEQPAAALWWRLSARLSTAAVTAGRDTSSGTLRPGWTPDLAATIGSAPAERVLADPGWPALVAAVTTAGTHGWQPADVLATAHDLLLDSHPEDTPPRPGELATALAWRVRLLTDATRTPGTPTTRTAPAGPAGSSTTAAPTGTTGSTASATGVGPAGDDPTFPTDADAPADPEDRYLDHDPHGHPNINEPFVEPGATPPEHAPTWGAVPGADDGTRDLDWLASLTPPDDPHITGSRHDHTHHELDQPDHDQPGADPAAGTAPGAAPGEEGTTDPWARAMHGQDLESAFAAYLAEQPTAIPAETTPAAATVTGPYAPDDQVAGGPDVGDATWPGSRVGAEHGSAGELFATSGQLSAQDIVRGEVLHLHSLAAAFYAEHYTDAWAADCVAERLGTNLTGDPRFTLGYAPASWTGLTDHLRSLGATEVDLLAAGLSVRASNGRLIDRFRDRLLTPIRDGQDITGFIGRRNPDRTDDDHAGPKYLNTAETVAFTKGRQLFGLAENRAALTAGATPVLVERFLDAIAVTLAGDTGDGPRYVGLAPLGTSLTDHQVGLLRADLAPAGTPARDPRTGQHDPRQVIVATDSDRAGQQAAHRAYYKLLAHGQSPRHLSAPTTTTGTPTVKDPAELLQTAGPAGLRAALDSAAPLASTVVADRVDAHAASLRWAEGRIAAVRAAAPVIAGLPPADWPNHITAVAERTGVAHPQVVLEVLDAAQGWTADPRAAAARQLAQPIPDRAPAPPAPLRWAQLGEQVHPGLTGDPHWPALAATLDRAAAHGHDPAMTLPALAARRPLDPDHPGRDLDDLVHHALPSTLEPHHDRRPVTEQTATGTQAHGDQWPATRQEPITPAADPDHDHGR